MATPTAATAGTTPAGTLGSAGTYGRVILTIKSAHNLTDKAFIGKSDPYCMVRVSDAEIQTAHVKNAGEHCAWDESFAFNNVAPTDVVEFRVYDYNRVIKDAFMGEGSITLRQVFEEGRLETRLPLASRSGVKDAGEVWISMRLEEGPGGAAGVGATAPTTTTGAGAVSPGVGGVAAGEAAYAETGKPYEGVRGGIPEGERYGEREGYEGRQAAVPAAAVTQTTTAQVPATAAAGGAVGEAVQTGREAACGHEYFTKVEDRPVIMERVTYVKEHRPVEKEYVVETRATGVEREAAEGRVQESLGTQSRVVEEAKPRAPCE